jgi:hypothetical protein
MLYNDEKELVRNTMKMFSNSYMGENLIKQTARYMSAKLPTWKRFSIYNFAREYYNSKYKNISTDVVVFNYAAKIENWFCVLWYDGPRIYEDASETKIMIQTEELGLLERFTVIHCSYDCYTKMMEEEQSTIRKIQYILMERGIKEEQVFIFYNGEDGIFIQENKETEETKPCIVHPWSDRLYNTNPEWFI